MVHWSGSKCGSSCSAKQGRSSTPAREGALPCLSTQMPPVQGKNVWGGGDEGEQGPLQGAPPGSLPENDSVNLISHVNIVT